MLFPTTISLLLPALALASPLLDPRQPAPQARFVGTFTATPGCGAGATLSLDATQGTYDILYNQWDSLGPPTGAGTINAVSYGAGVSIPAKGEAYY
ncbi:hypothetical protein GE09DRAFT_1216338 [Coniochaeta sp. 2T2.1]|nr:hypothetical protein GE09DRAFT_1216338 [Coniochaeta sp. 2T2.1]